MPDSKQGSKPGLAGLAAPELKDFVQEIALLYSAAETGAFLQVLRRFLAALAPFDHLTVFCQKDQDPPRLVWSTFQPSVIQSGVRNYIEGTYLIDPFTRAFRSGAPEGAYRGIDMAPYVELPRADSGSLPLRIRLGEELGFLTEDWPANLAELQIVFSLGLRADRGFCCQVGLYRNPGAPTFSTADARLLTGVTPVVAGAFSTYWSRLAASDADPAKPACFELLSPRERSVIELVSQGFTSAAIAALLRVSLETVKTHRKRAYRKLSISSQAELFALMQPAPSPIRYHSDAETS